MKSDSSYFCMHCKLGRQESEIGSLKSAINDLAENVRILTENLASIHPASSEEATVLPQMETSITTYATVATTKCNTATTKPEPKAKDDPSDRKFNVVVHGISEWQKGTPRSVRMSKDFESVVSVLFSVDSNVQSHSIRDCFHLGKFKGKGCRPRPVLVRLICAPDVSSLLVKRRANISQHHIKPDLISEDHTSVLILLKQR